MSGRTAARRERPGAPGGVPLEPLVRSIARALGLRRLRRLARAVATIVAPLARRDRRRALAHLAEALPGVAGHAVVRALFAHLAESVAELAWAGPDRAGALVDWAPGARETLDAAVARGRGVVFATGHLGNWELLGRAVAAAGFPLTVVAARHPRTPRADRYTERWRAAAGLATVWREDRSAARALLTALRTGHLVAILIDQDTHVTGTFVPFFGRPAWTPVAPAQLARRTGAALVLAWGRRGPDGRHTLNIREVEPPAGDDDASLHATTERLTAELESAVRAHPDQWVWMHKRWRRTPESREIFVGPPPLPPRAEG